MEEKIENPGEFLFRCSLENYVMDQRIGDGRFSGWINISPHVVSGPQCWRRSSYSVAVFVQILQVECTITSWCLVCRCVCRHKPHLVKGLLHKCGRIDFHNRRCLMILIHFLRFINEEYAGLLDPRDQYRLAATESEMWSVFALRR